MTLYTMMPLELIFPNEGEVSVKQKIVTYQGVSLLVETSDPSNVSVVRILSTDPQHFIDGRFSPGSKISLTDVEGLSAF